MASMAIPMSRHPFAGRAGMQLCAHHDVCLVRAAGLSSISKPGRLRDMTGLQRLCDRPLQQPEALPNKQICWRIQLFPRVVGEEEEPRQPK